MRLHRFNELFIIDDVKCLAIDECLCIHNYNLVRAIRFSFHRESTVFRAIYLFFTFNL